MSNVLSHVVDSKEVPSWLKLNLISSCVLVAMLPVGIYLGTQTILFLTLFFIHLITLCAALPIGYVRVAQALELSPLCKKVCSVVLVVFILFVALESSLPITARDALIHHLAVPKWWAQDGYITSIPWHEWSFYPMLLQLAYTAMLSLHIEGAFSLYHALYLLFSVLAVVEITRRISSNKNASLFTGVCLLILPLCLKLSTSPLVDLGLLFYMSAALLIFVMFIEDLSTIPLSALVWLSLSLGFALSAKYNGLLALPLMFISALLASGVLRKKEHYLKIIGIFILIGILSAVCFSPWAIKNYLWTSNPIYPLAKGIFGQAPQLLAPPAEISPIERHLLLYQSSWLEIFLLPVRMLVFGRDGDPKAFDGVLSPVLIISVFALFKCRSDKRVLFLVLFSALYYVFAMLNSAPRVRYLIPMIGSLVVIASLGLEYLARALSKEKLVWRLGFIACFLWSGIYSVRLVKDSDLVEYLSTGDSNRVLYRRIPEYPLIQFINNELAQDIRVYLLLTGNQYFLYDREVFSGGYFSAAPLVNIIKSSNSPEDMAKQFYEQRITHVLAHAGRTQALFAEELTRDQQLLWNAFVAGYLSELRSARGTVLFSFYKK